MLRKQVNDLMGAQEMLWALSAHFKVSTPKLIFGRTRRGWFRVNRYTGEKSVSVHSSPVGGWSIANTLIHEFAHHLDYSRRGKTFHDKPFWEALTEVAAAWYGNPAEYCWHLEYATIRAAGPAPHADLKIDTDALLAQL